MTCSELRDEFELYALGLAEEPERGEIRAHLERGCQDCTAEMKRAREMAARLALAAPPAAPSPRLRRRILASAGFERRGVGLALSLAGAAVFSLCAAVYFSGRERDLTQEVLTLREQSRTQNIELTRLGEAYAILSGPETMMIAFGQAQPWPKGKVFVNPSLGVLLMASGLPRAPAGKMYEMWIVSKGALPSPAGMFQAERDGTAMHSDRCTVNVASTDAVAVTLEAEAGAGQPTSKPLILAPLRPALQ